MTSKGPLRIGGIGAATIAVAASARFTSVGERGRVTLETETFTSDQKSHFAQAAALLPHGRLVRSEAKARFPSVVMRRNCRGIFFRISARPWQRREACGLNAAEPNQRRRQPRFARAEIPAIFDSLNPRSPLEIRSRVRPRDAEKLTVGLSKPVSATDPERLAESLSGSDLRSCPAHGVTDATCSVRERTDELL